MHYRMLLLFLLVILLLEIVSSGREAPQAKMEKSATYAEESQLGRKQFLQSTAYEDEFLELFGVVWPGEICVVMLSENLENQEENTSRLVNAIPYNIIHIFKMIFSKQFINTIKTNSLQGRI